MYYGISVLIGGIIACMVALNGGLSAQYGVFTAAVIIHVVGTAFAYGALRLRRQKIGVTRALPLWMFLGGVIGVLTTGCNNFAFGKISLTSIVALGLLGQMLVSLALDCWGLMGMQKQGFRPVKLLGLALAALGIWVMLQDMGTPAVGAMALSLGAGMSIVLSRSVNASLAAGIGALQASFVNHAVGLPVTIFALLVWGRAEPLFAGAAVSCDAWLYFGGVLGVLTVLLLNLTVPKIQAVHLTLLTFVGQVFTGILLDALLGKAYQPVTFYGGMLVAAGVLVNLLLEAAQKRRQAGAP